MDWLDKMFEEMVENLTYKELCELIAETDNYNSAEEA